MGKPWIILLLCSTFIQGMLTFSPIPEPEEEWDDFVRILRNPAYRLPTTTRPSKYEINLTPYFDVVPINTEPFSFDGIAVIYTSPTVQNVNEIVMHCNELIIHSVSVSLNNEFIELTNDKFECEMPYSFLRIPTNQSLLLGQEYVVRIAYTGKLKDTMRGFYRSQYKDSSGTRWMGTTQFQPGHAREAFPCYDEPAFKAFFDITINREVNFSPSISNMPIKSSETLINSRIADTFFTTPLTSTYLVAFVVSHYEIVSPGTHPNRPFNIYARNNAGKTGDWSLYIGELLLNQMEHYTNISYYNMANNLDMKQAAIPDFSAGAMENWGILTYREALILYDPINSNHFYRQRVANIVSHEIAHMWFGNLVTCAWWDNLWLNEGFARFYQYYLTHMVAEELGYDIRFIVEQVQQALLSDSVDSAHALTDPNVIDPTSVSNHFSVITYAKGASVLRMTQHFMDNSTFVDGLRIYLKTRQFDVSEPHHLFEALHVAALESGSLANYSNGITIESFLRSWSEQPGHPVLNVKINHRSGEMNITQARWERDTGTSQFSNLWQIPITWTRAEEPNFDNLKPSQVLMAESTVIDRGSQGYEWVIFNKQQSGFYRVNYDSNTWILITRALRSENRTVIHELNRAQIVNDVFSFARAGVMTYDQALNILSFLEFEDAYAPWIAAIDGFNFAINRLSYDAVNVQKLKSEAIKLSNAITSRLGYSERVGETYLDGLLRMYLHTFLCNIDHPQCLTAARVNFALWRNGGFVPANMRPWVYCSGLRQGNALDFDYFWNRFMNEDLAGEVVVMIQAAGCTSDNASLDKFLNAIIDSSAIIRAQDYSSAWSSAITGNEINAMRKFNWLQRNILQVTQRLGSAVTPISNIASRLRNESQISEFSSWLEENQAILGSAYNTGINGIRNTRNLIEWSRQRVPEFETFFESGYVEETLEDISDGGNEDPNSANIANLSFFPFILLLVINFTM